MPAGATPTVLVVDDDQDIQDSIRLILDGSGYRTLGASNGAEALHLLQTMPHVDLVLLDMMMPTMDGPAFRQAQIAVPSIARVPVVVLTGDGRARDKAAALGAVGYLKKPLDLDDLLDVVARHTAA